MSSSGNSDYFQKANDEIDAETLDAIHEGEEIGEEISRLNNEKEMADKVISKLEELKKKLEKEMEEWQEDLKKPDQADSGQQIAGNMAENERVIGKLEFIIASVENFSELAEDELVDRYAELEDLITMAEEWVDLD